MPLIERGNGVATRWVGIKRCAAWKRIRSDLSLDAQSVMAVGRS